MKRLNFKSYIVFLLFAAMLTGCSSDDDSTSPDQGNDDPAGENDIVATIETENDGTVEFGYDFPDTKLLKPSLKQESGTEVYSFGLSATSGKYNLTIIGSIDGEGEYSLLDGSSTGVTINLNRDGDDDGAFSPVGIQDAIKGKANLHITSLTQNHIKATFSATLYHMSTGEKATISNGELDSEITREVE